MCLGMRQDDRISDLPGILKARAIARRAARDQRIAQRRGIFGGAVETLVSRARAKQAANNPSAPAISDMPMGGSSLGQ